MLSSLRHVAFAVALVFSATYPAVIASRSSSQQISQFPPAFYVSPTGADSSDNCQQSTPCQTITHAMSLMERGSVKTTYLLPGTYKPSAPFHLTSADNGETIAGAPTNSSWQSVILDGTNSLEEIFWIDGGSRITISNLTMNNLLYMGVCIHGGPNFTPASPNCFQNGVGAASGNVVSNSEIYNLTMPTASWRENAGCVSAEGNVPDTVVDHIYCHQSQGTGIRVSANQTGGTVLNSVISNNAIMETVQDYTDLGAIFTGEVDSSIYDTISITNNFIRGYHGGGTAGVGPAWCIYLDNGISNSNIIGNICAGAGANPGGITQGGMFIHCGDNNNFYGNILDLGTDPTVIPFGIEIGSGCSGTPENNLGTGNNFNSNIVVENYPGALSANFNGVNDRMFLVTDANGSFSMNSNGNAYWNYGGGSASQTGYQTGDSSTLHGNPQISGTTYTINGGSAVYSSPVNFPGITGGWGPKGFTVPADAAVPPSTTGMPPGYTSPVYSCVYTSGSACGNEAVTRTCKSCTATDLLPTDSSGHSFNTFSNNVLRITRSKGILIEESRTNYLLNSTSPATQTTGFLATGNYCLWVNGSGSALASAGTATITGAGSATNGSPNVFTVATAGTVTVTVTGSLNDFQLENSPDSYSCSGLIVTANAAGTRNIESPVINNTGTLSNTVGTYIGEFYTPYAIAGMTGLVSSPSAPTLFIKSSSVLGYKPGNIQQVSMSYNLTGGTNVLPAATVHRAGYSFSAAGDNYVGFDGLSPQFVRNATSWTSPSFMSLGLDTNYGNAALNGFMRSLAIYGYEMNPSLMQAYTVAGKAY